MTTITFAIFLFAPFSVGIFFISFFKRVAIRAMLEEPKKHTHWWLQFRKNMLNLFYLLKNTNFEIVYEFLPLINIYYYYYQIQRAEEEGGREERLPCLARLYLGESKSINTLASSPSSFLFLSPPPFSVFCFYNFSRF